MFFHNVIILMLAIFTISDYSPTKRVICQVTIDVVRFWNQIYDELYYKIIFTVVSLLCY